MARGGRAKKKEARRANNQNRGKHLGQVDAPAAQKKLAEQESDSSYLDERVQWTAETIDKGFAELGCRWELNADEVAQLLTFLNSLTQKTWREVRAETDGKGRPRNHGHSLTDIAREAQDRLIELDYEAEETIFRFRIQGQLRLWGFRSGNLFRILWYDPEHKVYPVSKKNT